jgi:hypothetical protein
VSFIMAGGAISFAKMFVYENILRFEIAIHILIFYRQWR